MLSAAGASPNRPGYFCTVLSFASNESPLEFLFEKEGVQLWVKRDDLLHPEISGNKWRKLKYHYEAFRRGGFRQMLTFGGAFSNHLAALAALGKETGTPAYGLVRGEEVKDNATLAFCRSCGMEIESLSRKRYALKDDPDFLAELKQWLPEVYLIPEGGKGLAGAQGCREIAAELPSDTDFLALPAGTGTTAAGLLAAQPSYPLLVFPALKGARFLRRAIVEQALALQEKPLPGPEKLRFFLDYHGGGYGKAPPDLIAFMNRFYREYELKLDPVYTGKMFFGLVELINQGYFPRGSKVVALHTGGLQGIAGMNAHLASKKQNTLIYEA